MHHEWPAVPDPDFEIREGAGGCGGRFTPKFLFGPKIRGAPGPSPGSATTQSVGGPEQGSQRCFAGVTGEGLVTSATPP